MNYATIEQLLTLAWEHLGVSVQLSYNNHKSGYTTFAKVVHEYSDASWVNPEERAKAVENNTCWTAFLSMYNKKGTSNEVLRAASLPVLLQAIAAKDQIAKHINWLPEQLVAEVTDLQKQVDGLLRGEYTSAHITFNDHKTSGIEKFLGGGAWKKYIPAMDEYLEMNEIEDSFVSDEERAKSLTTDTLWCFQWYPDTPIGFYSLYGSTLTACVNAGIDD